MDTALSALMTQIKSALAAEGTKAAPKHDLEALRDLLPTIRTSLHHDDVDLNADDTRIAARVAMVLPNLHDRLKQSHLDARTQLERDYPAALQPLFWDLDLLGPLGRARSEVSHTQCLAYLLDHRESHGLGVRVLREFFALMGRVIPGEDAFEQLGKNTEENNERLRRVRVFAEHCVDSGSGRGGSADDRRCDVWLELVEENRAMVVVIENKIDAGEHSAQLSSYEQALWQAARRLRKLSFEAKLIFLTPDGRQPEGQFDQSVWLPIGYRQIAAAFAHASRDAAEPGRTFLQTYVSTILKNILGVTPRMDDAEFVRQLPYMNEVIKHGASHE
jgi:hypothetical protein